MSSMWCYEVGTDICLGPASYEEKLQWEERSHQYMERGFHGGRIKYVLKERDFVQNTANTVPSKDG